MELDPGKMPEAEVSARLAIMLIESGHAQSDVSVAIDGAQVKTGDNAHFPLMEFMQHSGWIPLSPDQNWQGQFGKFGFHQTISVHSSAGQGDVVATLSSGKILRVESKKGPLKRSRSSQEYPLTREAIGQLLTVEKAGTNDILAVAVPYSPKFKDLADQWRARPLMKHAGINTLTIDRCNIVRGLEHVGI